LDSEDPDFVSALARGLSVIKVFGQDAEALTLSEVALRTQLSRGTARRLLLTLGVLGYVRQDAKSFRLTPKVLELGFSYLSSIPIWKAAQPIMQDLVNKLNQSCALGALEGHDVVYIARTPPKHLSYLPVTPGTRMPAHLNAMGQVLLAGLPASDLEEYFKSAPRNKLTKHTLVDENEIRKTLKKVLRDGYALSDRQIHSGIRAIAVPISSKHGRPEFSLNASAEDSLASRSDLIEHFLPALRRAADELSQML
jgi:IclR family pca regulon transcriptional regulator